MLLAAAVTQARGTVHDFVGHGLHAKGGGPLAQGISGVASLYNTA